MLEKLKALFLEAKLFFESIIAYLIGLASIKFGLTMADLVAAAQYWTIFGGAAIVAVRLGYDVVRFWRYLKAKP